MLGKSGKMFSTVLFLIVLITGISLAAKAFAGEVIKVGGVGSALGTMKILGEAFEKKHPDIKVQVLSSLGSAGGINALLNGAVDIAISGRPLKDEEREKGAIAAEYAKTPMVFVTSNNNASGLSAKELIKVYEGKMQTWPDGKRIRPVLRPEGDSDTLIIKDISPEMEPAIKNALSRQGMIVALTDQESADIAEKTDGSLGISTLTQIISEKRSLKVLSFNGVKPSLKTLSIGSYTLFKSLYMVTTSKTSKPAKQFISFVFSTAGRKILTKNGNLVVEQKSER